MKFSGFSEHKKLLTASGAPHKAPELLHREKSGTEDARRWATSEGSAASQHDAILQLQQQSFTVWPISFSAAQPGSQALLTKTPPQVPHLYLTFSTLFTFQA